MLAVALVAAPAAAESDDALGRARTHFEAGRALYSLGNYTEAQREFAAGYQLAPRPQFLINLGHCYRKLDDLPRARAMYRRYLAEARADDPLRAQAEQVLAEVEHELAAAEAAPAASSPPGSAVLVAPAPAKQSFLRRHWWIIPASAAVVGVAVGVGVYFGTRADPCRGANLTCWDLSK